MTDVKLTPAQQVLSDIWDEHVRDEFATKDAAGTLDTMVPDAYVNHIPVLTGGVGRDDCRSPIRSTCEPLVALAGGTGSCRLVPVLRAHYASKG
jgi:hypothetical protein